VIAAFRERFNKAPPPNQFKIYIESEVRIFWVYGDFSATLYRPKIRAQQCGRSTLNKSGTVTPHTFANLRVNTKPTATLQYTTKLIFSHSRILPYTEAVFFLTFKEHLVLRLRTSGAMPPLPLHTFMSCTETLPFYPFRAHRSGAPVTPSN